MQELNYLTMLVAVRNCLEHEWFSVVIITKTRANHKNVLMEIIECMNSNEREAIETVLANGTAQDDDSHLLLFRNGSIIKILSEKESMRGYTFNSILCESGVNQDLLERVASMKTTNERGHLCDQ